MSTPRVALVFDDQLRPETTGVYCRRALEKLTSVRHFLPSQLSQIRRGEFDLFVNIDDGLRYEWPPQLTPSVCWVIDTHLEPQWCIEKASQFDLAFAAQKDGTRLLRENGSATASWLPLACDPIIHRRHDVTEQWDVCFVGHLFSGRRASLVRLLQQEFPNSFVGECFFEDMARAYSAARCVFNCSLKNDLNMRVFEAMACGSLLITDDLGANGLEELFQDGTHLASYLDAGELLDKLNFYLLHEDARRRLASCGQAIVLENHTYRHRMQRLISEASRLLSSNIPRRLAQASTTLVMDGHRSEGQPVAIKDCSYFYWSRPEILELVPPDARHILEIGCGAGSLGASIKLRQSARVIGVEFDSDAATCARNKLDELMIGEIETMEFPISTFDCVICADVLEHLRDPRQVLFRVKSWLKSDGVLIASIPNVQQHGVVVGLLEGNWTYERAGLLDRTHRHFFTRQDAFRLLADAGFGDIACTRVPGPGHGEWVEQGQPDCLSLGRLRLDGVKADLMEDFFTTYQLLLVARPAQVCGTQTASLVNHSNSKQLVRLL